MTLSSYARPTYRPVPVLLEIFLFLEHFTFFILEGRASYQYFEKGYAKRPDIGFTRIVGHTTSTFGR